MHTLFFQLVLFSSTGWRPFTWTGQYRVFNEMRCLPSFLTAKSDLGTVFNCVKKFQSPKRDRNVPPTSDFQIRRYQTEYIQIKGLLGRWFGISIRFFIRPRLESQNLKFTSKRAKLTLLENSNKALKMWFSGSLTAKISSDFWSSPNVRPFAYFNRKIWILAPKSRSDQKYMIFF